MDTAVRHANGSGDGHHPRTFFRGRIARRALGLAALLFLVVFLAAGCGDGGANSDTGSSAPTSVITLEEAREMAQTALEAYNAGDYASWSRDWSQTMKDAIPETAFQDFRRESMETYGKFVEIDDVRLVEGEAEGIVRFEVPASFENGDALYWFAVPEDGRQIEGVRLEPVD